MMEDFYMHFKRLAPLFIRCYIEDNKDIVHKTSMVHGHQHGDTGLLVWQL